MFLELSPTAHLFINTLTAPIIYLIILPITVIYHTTVYFLQPIRHPKWTFAHYMTINLRRVLYQYSGYHRVPLRDPEEDIIPLGAVTYRIKSEVKRVWCLPLREEVPRVDILKRCPVGVKSVQVPGFMIRNYHRRISIEGKESNEPFADLLGIANPKERIIYFIVGGGYTGGHPLRIHTPWSLAEITGVRVFCINYRKSLSSDTAFPASLLDCLAGYQYLVDELEFLPSSIMLCGDSAGANACMALAKYLSEIQMGSTFTSWGQVGSMCLHSPWSDMTSSFPSISINRYTDHLVDLTTVNIPSHTRHFSTHVDNLYFSPALAKAGQFTYLVESGVKVYISGGTAEAFYDEIKALYEGMLRDGVDVKFRQLPGATHSDFVWMDRNMIQSMGVTWPIIKNDFVSFWEETGVD